MDALEKQKYPIGNFTAPDKFRKGEIGKCIKDIDKMPKRLKEAVKNLTDEQLDTAYRPNGWTVRQVVHHLADSHMNAYIRFRLALTEDNPTIKPYEEAKWAELNDAKSAPIKFSLDMLRNLHKRWVMLLKSMDKDLMMRTYFHPEKNRAVPLWEVTAMYGWHSNHHLAHIEELKKSKGWK